ncbi:hypothetical protein ACJX0J_021036, partial [Zea mays]
MASKLASFLTKRLLTDWQHFIRGNGYWAIHEIFFKDIEFSMATISLGAYRVLHSVTSNSDQFHQHRAQNVEDNDTLMKNQKMYYSPHGVHVMHVL